MHFYRQKIWQTCAEFVFDKGDVARAGGLAHALSKGIMRFLRATSPQRKAHSESAFSKRARNFVTCATLHFVRFYSCHHHFPTHLRTPPQLPT